MSENNTAAMREIMAFLQEARVFFLATIDGDRPQVRPFGAVCETDGRLYLVTGNQKPVYAQMIANPHISLSAMTSDGRWLRLSAEAVRDDRREARKAMLDANPDLRALYNEDDGVVEVFYLQNAEAAVCTFTAPPVVYRF